MRYLIGRYHEIALKGRNQWRFVDQLKQNLRDIFADYRLGNVRSIGPRLTATLPDDLTDDLAAERAALIFGIQNFSISRAVPRDIESIAREAIARASGNPAKTFRVRTRREDKRYPMTSPEIDREVGALMCEALGLKVDLDDAELTISIEIMNDAALVSAGKMPGAGGLPVGISGRGMALLSGGIDSPVAAYRMMKRGLALDFVHFHAHPLVSPASREKAADLAAHLTRYQARSTLMQVPFGNLQREIVANTLRPLRVVLYRRFMLRIASALAERSGATVLVTGESLGQVASQTLVNMAVIEKAASFPILRPLVGMDKSEIIDQARVLGTFETSILPDQDCCTLFVPAHPETRARIEEVEAAESRFDIPRMIADAVNATEVQRFQFPPRNSAAPSRAAETSR
ncbi:MAG: tRNA uracil 4-sulfurtransferase ThiI [Candidatus Binatus sp.]|uniref:tRNA uracil 4-sulfurtransferase ThiI n=1 Tax=Candidatus Binatus sp. TaxID=2811406 RepID=UPI00271D3755|nr:tRNA uracil 4-sulfurtransferase ThiI [Candidatus Binatus sp.]MDO8434797.1 tRNA uracil 4-sulfurtransferase ThiI [Candidatus Binatus sp.]